jgi:hypothetical protein
MPVKNCSSLWNSELRNHDFGGEIRRGKSMKYSADGNYERYELSDLSTEIPILENPHELSVNL